MEKLSVHPKSFIRPSPSAGSLGGWRVRRVKRLYFAKLPDLIRYSVKRWVWDRVRLLCIQWWDFFLLIQLAGTGDELQGIKRGIMEMADGIVINKADGDNLERAKLAAAQFRNALHLFPAPESGWTPQVLTYSGFL